MPQLRRAARHALRVVYIPCVTKFLPAEKQSNPPLNRRRTKDKGATKPHLLNQPRRLHRLLLTTRAVTINNRFETATCGLGIGIHLVAMGPKTTFGIQKNKNKNFRDPEIATKQGKVWSCQLSTIRVVRARSRTSRIMLRSRLTTPCIVVVTLNTSFPNQSVADAATVTYSLYNQIPKGIRQILQRLL